VPSSYLPLGPNLPEYAVEIAFASLPTDATQVWTDVSRFVRALSIRRGRQDELARVEAGTLDLLLDNRDARFNPENTSSPYYGNLVPKRQVRVLARSGATTATLFTGFVGGFSQEWPDAGTDAVVRLGAVDLMGLLARAKLSAPPYRILSGLGIPDETTTSVAVNAITLDWPRSFPYTITVGAEVGRREDMTVTDEPGFAGTLTVTRGANGTAATSHIIQPSDPTAKVTTQQLEIGSGLSGGWIGEVIQNSLWAGTKPANFYDNVMTGLSTVLSTGPISVDTSPRELIQAAVDSENGLFYAGVDGRPVFHDRHYRILTTAITATFGEIPPEIPYIDVEVSHDEGQLYNTVVITASGGQQLTATDATSAATYWPQTLARTTIGLPGQAQDLADYLLGRFKDPQLRAPDLVLDGHNVPGATLIGLDLDQRYTVKRRPAAGTAINKEVFVEGVTHTLAPAQWVTSLNLSNADIEEYWILDSSRLDVDTRLAF
jgi:hypothetical protein